MNDDFLYRIRTEPPPRFAQALKERLDRAATRRSKLASVGFGLFLFGTAFALVSPVTRETIAGWFASEPHTREIPQLASAPAEPPGSATVDSSFVDERSPAQRAAGRAVRVKELLREVEMTLGAQIPVTLPPLPGEELPSADIRLDPPADTQDDAPADAPSEFITTGPLLAELKTPANAFDKRRALCTLMAWTVEPANAVLRHGSQIGDPRKIELAAKRLRDLAPMLYDAFAFDTRASAVQTRALDAVWEKPDLFSTRIEEMKHAARILETAAQRGIEINIRQSAARVSFTCARCHEDFRKNGNANLGEKYP